MTPVERGKGVIKSPANGLDAPARCMGTLRCAVVPGTRSGGARPSTRWAKEVLAGPETSSPLSNDLRAVRVASSSGSTMAVAASVNMVFQSSRRAVNLSSESAPCPVSRSLHRPRLMALVCAVAVVVSVCA